MISVRELRAHTKVAKNREKFTAIFSSDLLDEAKEGKSEAELSYNLDETPFKEVEEVVDFLETRGFQKVSAVITDDGARAPFLTISLSWDIKIF